MTPRVVISTEAEGAKRLRWSGEIPKLKHSAHADTRSSTRASSASCLGLQFASTTAKGRGIGSWVERLESASRSKHRRDLSAPPQSLSSFVLGRDDSYFFAASLPRHKRALRGRQLPSSMTGPAAVSAPASPVDGMSKPASPCSIYNGNHVQASSCSRAQPDIGFILLAIE